MSTRASPCPYEFVWYLVYLIFFFEVDMVPSKDVLTRVLHHWKITYQERKYHEGSKFVKSVAITPKPYVKMVSNFQDLQNYTRGLFGAKMNKI